MQQTKGLNKALETDISIFHLIVWIFCVDNIKPQQCTRIRSFYGNSKTLINPTPRSLQEFKKAFKAVKQKNSKCVIKVVVAERFAEDLLDYANKKTRITQVYVYADADEDEAEGLPSTIRAISKISRFTSSKRYERLNPEHESEQKIQNLSRLEGGFKVTGLITDLDEIIQRASREVESFTKSYRTFNNSLCLAGNFAEKANLYRFRLISCIHQNISDFNESFQRFQDFVGKQFAELNQNILANNGNCISKTKVFSNINEYRIKAQEFIQRELTHLGSEGQTSDESYRSEFYKQMIRLYKEEGVLYQLINNGLRTISEDNAKWQVYSLPFSHLYNAIKTLSETAIKEEQQHNSQYQFYTKDFTVYRGGRIRKSEIEEYKKHERGAFVEFFGFMSTSLNLEVAVNFLRKSQKSKDSEQRDEIDENCLFKIHCKYNSKLQEQKYDFLRHGFYRFESQEEKGYPEQQVLFNSLNIFRIVAIYKKRVSELFTEEQRQKMMRKEEAKRQANHKSKKYEIKSNFYESEIYIIELDFGAFFDVLFEKSMNLTNAQRIAKENYVYCINKIKKCDKFDFADAYELTNQMQKSYDYLKRKVAENDSSEHQQFKISRMDNKNYYARLSSVCNKLGKIKQGLKTTKISIQCYQQLENIHMSHIYDSHFETWCEMKMRILDIYMQNSNYLSAQIYLKDQFDFIKGKQFKGSKAKLRESQIILNQAVVDFYVGKLKESLTKFKVCKQNMKETVNLLLADEDIPCYFNDYIINMFCGEEKCMTYSQFGKRVKEKKKEQLRQKIGGEKQLKQTEHIAVELAEMAKEILKKQKKYFKNQKEYEDLISRFNQQQQSLLSNQNEDRTEQELFEWQLKEIMKELSTYDVDDQRYKIQFDIFKTKCQQLKDRKNLRLNVDGSEIEPKFIQKFIEKERNRRLEHIKKTKDKVLKQNQQRLIDYYQREALQIETAIQELRNQGFSNSAIVILKKRNQKANFYYESDNKKMAMEEIKMILQHGKQKGEDKNYELACAFLTQGKIQLKIREEDKACDSFEDAISYFQKTVNEEEQEEISYNNDDERMDGTSINEINKQFLLRTVQNDLQMVEDRRKNQKQNILNHNNDYLESKILRAKSLLFRIDKLSNEERSIPTDIFLNISSRRTTCQNSMYSRLMGQAQKLLGEVQSIIIERDKIEEIDNLKADLNEVKANYHFRHRNHRIIEEGFTLLDQCFAIRNQKLGQNNSLNLMSCFEVIFRLYKNPMICEKIIAHNLLKVVEGGLINFQKCNFFWEIFKAFFLMEYYRKDGNKEAAKEHLTNSINFLQNIERDTINESELSQLKDYLHLYEQKRPIALNQKNDGETFSQKKESIGSIMFLKRIKEERQENIEEQNDGIDSLNERSNRKVEDQTSLIVASTELICIEQKPDAFYNVPSTRISDSNTNQARVETFTNTLKNQGQPFISSEIVGKIRLSKYHKRRQLLPSLEITRFNETKSNVQPRAHRQRKDFGIY